MLGSFATALVLAASVSRIAASPINHIARGYAQDAAILEDYTPYHVRYLALDCQDKHNTPFFEKCCHPLLRTQKLSDRPKERMPSASASSSAALAEPTSAPIDEDPVDDDDDCETETEPAPTPAPTPSKKPEPAPETTSVKTSSTPEPKPEPTPEPTTSHHPTTTTDKPEPTKSADPEPGNGSGTITGGFATFYEQGGVAGACGDMHSDDDLIVAMDYRKYGNVDKVSKFCGKK
ncbi:hypothetical protein FRC12_024387, partial [Ceratobasidium sp. 428]